MQYDVGIRVDMGGKIGSGHFFRCLAIAKELQKHKKRIIFLITKKKNFLKHMNEKIEYIELQKGTELKKINECKKLSNKINLFIIDLPQHNELYSKKLGLAVKKIIFDDIGNKEIECEMIVNGTLVKKFQKYTILNKKTKVCLGPKYAILREQFYKNKKKFRISKKIKKILITFGGNDENDYSYKISKILIQKDFQITVVLGPTYKNYKKILEFSKKYKNLKIKQNVKNISKLFLSQDLVICSVGITVYELSCIGIPFIMIPDTNLQNIMANEIQKKGIGKNFGYITKKLNNLESNLVQLDSFEIRNEMSIKSKKIIDGKGTLRITKNLLKII